MQQTGLVDLPTGLELRETLHVRMSAGRMVLAPNIGEFFVE
jgi:hypothetical protein